MIQVTARSGRKVSPCRTSTPATCAEGWGRIGLLVRPQLPERARLWCQPSSASATEPAQLMACRRHWPAAHFRDNVRSGVSS